VAIFMLCLIFSVTALVAAMRNHWTEFGLFLFLAVSSALGFVFRLLA